ncbi:MAG: AAA family ATPase [Pyrinomonadaceae bacterium]
MIEPSGAFAVCPACGYRHKFVRLPLFILTGASGAGKSTVCLALASKTAECVVMESDILWRDEFNRPETDYREYRETWLRLCKNISQAGKPVVLCGAAVPAQFEQCVERRYFSTLHYLALVCEDEILAARLRHRPSWRGSFKDEYIKEHLAFNRWLMENAAKTEPPVTLLDTSGMSVDESVKGVEQWIRLSVLERV